MISLFKSSISNSLNKLFNKYEDNPVIKDIIVNKLGYSYDE